MNFDQRNGTPPSVSAQNYIREAAKHALSEQDFYTGGLLHASSRAITFAHVPGGELLRGLPQVEVEVTRRTVEEAAKVRADYQRMLRSSGLRTNLERRFLRKVQEEICRHQQGRRHSLQEPTLERIRQELQTYELHHRIPISLGGTNNFTNLVFVPHGLHTRIHVAINRATSHLREGMRDTITLPYPQGIFPVNPHGGARRKTTTPEHAIA